MQLEGNQATAGVVLRGFHRFPKNGQVYSTSIILLAIYSYLYTLIK